MRRMLDQKLATMNNELMLMGGICEDCIKNAFVALKTGDRNFALKISTQEYEIVRRARVLENLCLDLLLREQPVAIDLRCVSAVLKMTTDLERIGCQGCDIAQLVMHFDFGYHGEDVKLLEQMADEVSKMVHEAIDAYVKKDLLIVRAVTKHDDVVDKYFTMVKKELLLKASATSDTAEIALDVFMMAKYLERIGDHACNMAKWTSYAITGQNEQADLAGEL